MRWWSECTASWREKWNIVRMERNRAREDANVLRQLLKSAQQDLDRMRSMKHYINGEAPKSKSGSTSSLLSIPPPPEPSSKCSDVEIQTDDSKLSDESNSPSKFNFSELATEVEILTAKCKELEAAKDAAFDDVSFFQNFLIIFLPFSG